jgi:hypothetical protein
MSKDVVGQLARESIEVMYVNLHNSDALTAPRHCYLVPEKVRLLSLAKSKACLLYVES